MQISKFSAIDYYVDVIIMSDADDVERLKSELAAVKGRAVTKIKQQAGQILEQERVLKELRAQLTAEAASTSEPSSEEGDKERFVKVDRKAVDDEATELHRREDAVRRREEAVQARELALAETSGQPGWHMALTEGLQAIRHNLSSAA